MKDLWLLVIKLEEVSQSLNPKPPFDRWGDQGIEKRSLFPNKMGKWAALSGSCTLFSPHPPPHWPPPPPPGCHVFQPRDTVPTHDLVTVSVWQLRDSRVHTPESQCTAPRKVSQDQPEHSGSVMSKIYITQSWFQLVVNLFKSHFCFLCMRTKLL